MTRLVGGPLQNLRGHQPQRGHVLNANDSECWFSAKDPSDDVSVEVLVRCRLQRRGVPNGTGRKPSIDFVSDVCNLLEQGRALAPADSSTFGAAAAGRILCTEQDV